MPHSAPNPFERADVFKLNEHTQAASAPSTAENSESNDNAPITEAQYTALLRMMAEKLRLSAAEAERIFQHYKHESVDGEATDICTATKPSQPPPLCAHLSREDVMAYYGTQPLARTIPDVRCCDAREMHKQKELPAPCRGPHVHCLHCFRQSIDNARPPGRGVPPPIVADYCDSVSLRAHLDEHRQLYKTYLHILDDDSRSFLGTVSEVLDNDSLEACEAAAEEAGRHFCFMASLGTVTCPLIVFYCAECDSFAPLVHFRRTNVAASSTDTSGAETWVSTDGANVVLGRLLLSCHVLYMFDAQRFTHHQGSSERHLLYMFKPALFSVETEWSLIEEFESDAECTYAAVVLPNASVAGDPPQLLLREDAEGDASHTTPVSTRLSPVVIGFAMEWKSTEALQKKVSMVLEHHRRAIAACPQEGREPSPSSSSLPTFHVAARRVYIVDTGKWEVAQVLYHSLLPAHAELPQSYEDKADEGIRVQEMYEVDVPMPAWADVTISEDERNAVDTWSGEGKVGESSAAASNDALDMDGCPYSMESRTIDFFTRMMALAKAMRELAIWRLSIDENKDPSLL